MNVTEQVWFAVGIAGFVILLKGAVTYILDKFLKGRAPNFWKAITA